MNDRNSKPVISWALYDWASSAYSTTVMAGFFPVFFKKFWSVGADDIVTTARLGTTISVASLFIALLSPTLGVIADIKGLKKFFCLFFMVVGVIACGWMTFIPMGDWWSAIISYGIAMMAFNASSVFYDSLLPFVAQGKRMDYASSLGYSLGYLGGGILFLLNVIMYLKPSWFGIADQVVAIRYSFFTVALWWLAFSLPLARNVTEPKGDISRDSIFRLTKTSMDALSRTLRDLRRNKNVFLFLVAYWLYIDGVYTVMTMAVDFGINLGFEAGDLMTALLITQFIGFPFALGFGLITRRFGCRGPVLFCIVVYSITVILATRMTEPVHFYLLATVIGMVQGGVQSLSRSLFGRMIPAQQSGEYFGLFNLVGRFASILGPLIVAMGVSWSGNSRMGMMGLLVLFFIGGVLLWRVKEPAEQAR